MAPQEEPCYGPDLEKQVSGQYHGLPTVSVSIKAVTNSGCASGSVAARMASRSRWMSAPGQWIQLPFFLYDKPSTFGHRDSLMRWHAVERDLVRAAVQRKTRGGDPSRRGEQPTRLRKPTAYVSPPAWGTASNLAQSCVIAHLCFSCLRSSENVFLNLVRPGPRDGPSPAARYCWKWIDPTAGSATDAALADRKRGPRPRQGLGPATLISHIAGRVALAIALLAALVRPAPSLALLVSLVRSAPLSAANDLPAWGTAIALSTVATNTNREGGAAVRRATDLEAKGRLRPCG